jgi:YD repeat-containing protein
MQQQYPFMPIAGFGLGTKNSSLDQIGSLLPQKGFGGAGLQFFVNVANGNLVFRDRVLHIEDVGGPIDLCFTYNSQAQSVSSLWQFSHKKFTQLPSINDPKGQTAVLQETDGHLTTYTLKEGTLFYFAPNCSGEGTPWMQFDYTNKQWIWCHPAKNIKEYYSPTGLLLKRIDSRGRTLSYEYDIQNQLSAIVSESGSRYELRKLNNTSIGIYIKNGDIDQLLQVYIFDEKGRLSQSQTSDGQYVTKYKYLPTDAGWQLATVKQFDKTHLTFDYDNDSKKMTYAKLGDESVYNFQYIDQTHTVASIKDAFYGITEIGVDDSSRITSVSRSNGFVVVAPQKDITTYTYKPEGQLASIIYPNKGQESFEYHPVYGVELKHTQPDGQVVEKIYQEDGNVVRLICEIQYEGNPVLPLVIRYVYDTTYNSDYVFPRFKISPEGRVTEYRPQGDTGNIASKREYIAGNMKEILAQRDIHTAPSLQEMLDWVKKQDFQQVSLTEYAYNPRGQIVRTRKYSNVDKQGNGIVDSEMGEEFVFPNLFGNWFTKQVKQSDKISAITKRSLDNLQRVTSETDALSQTTQYKFLDAQAQLQITYPNQRVETRQKDGKGAVLQATEVAEGQIRTTTFGRDTNGRLVLTTRPDGQFIYCFYDHQDRLGFEVTTTGIVTEYRYDQQNKFNTKVQYSNAVDPTKLFLINPPPPGILPVASTLISLLPTIADPTNDRYSYSFLDASGRALYSVDSGQYITQYFYDQRNHKIAEMTYSDKLLDANLNALKLGQAISLQPDFTKDRCKKVFYDNDGLVIAKQDGAGFITEYVRDSAGRVQEKILYSTKMPVNPTQQNYIKPDTTNDDAHTYYFRNAKGLIIGEIDPDKYYTQHQYYPNGKKQKSIKFATQKTDVLFTPPNPSSEDQVTSYQYDLLDRPTEIDSPFQKAGITQFDIMGNPILSQTKDLDEPDNTDADHLRQTTAHFDGWDQKDTEINVFGGNITHKFDATGLKLHSTDALNRTTYYLYDNDRRPIVSIGPGGIIVERTLNSFGEEIQLRKYNQKISTGQIPEGGFLTADIRKILDALKDDTKDAITKLARNTRGLVEQKTDPNQFVSAYTYNAFKEPETENLPVESKAPSLTITHKYEARGLEVVTTKQAPGVDPAIASRLYENMYGKETACIDEQDGIYLKDYDVRGLLKKKECKEDINGPSVMSHSFTSDAFGRVRTETDAYGQTATHLYNQQKRTHTISTPVQGVSTTITANIFGEKVTEEDALEESQSWQHAPNGKVNKFTDQLKESSSVGFDVMGQKRKETDLNSVETDFDYEDIGYLQQKTEDATGLKLKTTLGNDAFGNPLKVTDPRKIVTQNTFDQRNQCLTSVQDADSTGLQLTTAKTFDGQGNVASMTQGDPKNPTLYQEEYPVDGMGRNTGKTIDPNGLDISTEKHFNPADLVISEKDANGNITRKFYNKLKQLRFIVDAEGGVLEHNYDKEGRRQYTRTYQQAIDASQLTDKSTLDTILSMVSANPQDSLLYCFYDANGKERFQVNSLGSVGERQYDLAQREILTIRYSTPIDISLLPTLTTDQLSTLMQSKGNPKDRKAYKILDAKGQVRFEIDGENYLTEKRFDANGNVTTRIQYANPVDPVKISKLSSEEVLANITPDPVNDRATYQVFDSRNKPQYVVDGEGVVTQFTHDEDGNLTQACIYSKTISVSQNYDDLVKLLKTLTPNPKIDRVTTSVFDKGNRKTQDVDPLGYIDKYAPDARGNILVHTDRSNNDWTSHFDAAERLDVTTTPLVPVTFVSSTKGGDDVLLAAAAPTSLQIQDKKVYDKAGNELQIIKAVNTPSARTLTCTYTKRNQLATTSVLDVQVDDPTKPASYDNPPVQTATINTTIIYNAKKLKICEQNEAGQWHFYVYDAEGRQLYEVDALGFVSQSLRNSFGEITDEIKFSNPINLDLTKYTQTGITLSVLQQNGIIVPSSEDRTTSYIRDNRGSVTLTQFGPTLYYLPIVGNNPQSKLGLSQTKQQYNAFGQVFYKSVLQDPDQNAWSQELTWFDRNGEKLAECNSVYAVKRRWLDSFRQEAKRVEWAVAPKVLPTSTTKLADLDSSYISDPLDKTFLYIYDLRGQCIQEIRKDVVTQEITFGDKNVPIPHNLPAEDLTKTYGYSPVQKQIATTYEDGSTQYAYFDPRGLEIARTAVPRVNGPSTLIPLTYFYNDAFGKQVGLTRFKTGTTSAGPTQLPPTPISTDPDDQTELKLFDIRGVPGFIQNAEGHTTGLTYSARRKLAREWNLRTGKYNNLKHIDEKRFAFDGLDHPVSMTILEDNKVFRISACQYNAFGNCVAEGPGDGTWPLYRRFDALNNCWSTNVEKGTNNAIEKGVNTIILRNLSGVETVRLQSATQDISGITYDQIPTLLTWNPAALERAETQRDYVGRAVMKTKPTYSQPDTSSPTNIPLILIAGLSYPDFGKTSLTWVQPQETNVTPQFTLWPTGNPQQKQTLPIKTSNNRCGIAVSALPSDVYSYEINYYFTNPITKQPEKAPMYQTQGSVQFDTGNNTNSLMLVVTVENESTLKLTGNTTNLTGIQLWQGTNKIADIPVQQQNGQYQVNLSQYNSGDYTVVPEVTGKTNLPQSLPFTIYTSKLSSTPLSKEIDSSFTLSFLEQSGHHGQLVWQVPKDYQSLPVTLTCEYIDNDDKKQTHKDTIKPDTNKGQYKDSKGNALTCNTEFEFQVKKITSIIVLLQLNDKDNLIIGNVLSPSSSEGDGTQIIMTDQFPSTTMLYITPLTGFTKLPTLSYLDTTLDRFAKWGIIPAIGMTSEGVVIEVTGLAPSVYPYKLSDQLSFWETSKDLHPAFQTLQASLSDSEEPIELREVVPLGLSEIGFRLLKTDRQTIATMLEQYQYDEAVRQKLVPEIHHALISKTFTPPSDRWDLLKAKHEDLTKKFKEHLRILQERKVIQNIDYDVKAIEKDPLKLALEDTQSKMLAYCSKPKVYAAYKEHLKTQGELGYQTALLYAKHIGFDLFLWEYDSEKPFHLKLIDSHNTGIETLRRLHFSLVTPNHFKVLLPKDVEISSVYDDAPIYSFTVPGGGVPYISTPSSASSQPVNVQPSYYLSYNNFNKLTKMVDTLGNPTEYAYNHNDDQLTLTQPPVNIVQPDGSTVVGRPVSSIIYNKRGFKMGETDPNGNTQASILDAAGQETALVLGEGTQSRIQTWNALSQRESHGDARGYLWNYKYNHLNSVLLITYPSTKTQQFGYDELNQRNVEIDQSGYATYYDFDPEGNIWLRVEPAGQATWMAYDRNKLPIYTAYPDGTTLTYTRNYFGIVISEKDRGNVTKTYWGDYKGQILRQFGNVGHGTYSAKGIVLTEPNLKIGHYEFGGKSKLFFFCNLPQDLSFQYISGRLMQVTDTSNYSLTQYGYDTEDREISVVMTQAAISVGQGWGPFKYQSGLTLLQQTQTLLDALGRDQLTYDTGATVATEYDANSNCCIITTTYIQPQVVRNYFDEANRIVIDGSTGLAILYTAGYRAEETKSGQPYRTLSYDPDGILIDTNYYQLIPGVLNAHRVYTPNGLLQSYVESQNGSPYFTHELDYYNANGWQAKDVQGQYDAQRNWQLLSSSTYSNFTPTGLPGHQSIQCPNVGFELDNTYMLDDEENLVDVSGRSYDKNGKGHVAHATSAMDANGVGSVMTGIQDENDPNSANTITKVFTPTYDGRILRRDNYFINIFKMLFDPDENIILNLTSTSHYFYNSRKEMIASYSTDPTNPEEYQTVSNYIQYAVGLLGGGASQNQKTQYKNQLMSRFSQMSRAFHLALPDFTMTYPAPMPKKYTVKPGDTFLTIALQMFGDGSEAYNIAVENGLSVDDQLQPGKDIDLPQYLPVLNNAFTSIPYERFVGIIMGSLYPHMDLKQPKKHSGGWFSTLIHVIVDVVAIVVSIYTFGTTSAFALAAIAATTAAADAAYQGVAVELGWQDHFSLRSAITTGIIAGVTAGIMTPGSAMETALASMAKTMAVEEFMLQAGAVAIANQFIAMATGVSNKFDFRAVIEEIGAAYLMMKIAPAEDDFLLGKDGSQFAKNVVNNETGGFIGAGLDAVISHQRIDVANVAAQTLGAAIGQEVGADIGNDIKEAWEAKNPQAASCYSQAQQDSASAQNPGRNRNGMFAGSSGSSSTSTIAAAPSSSVSTSSPSLSSSISDDDMLTSIGLLTGDKPLTMLAMSGSPLENPLPSALGIPLVLKPEVIDTITFKAIDALAGYESQFTPLNRGLQTSYYSRITNDYVQMRRMGDNIDFDPTSGKVPFWQAAREAAMDEVKMFSQLARYASGFNTFAENFGRFGGPVAGALEFAGAAASVYEDPSARNVVANVGGVGGSMLTSGIVEGLTITEGAELAIAAIAAPELVIPAIATMGLGTAGFFAGKEFLGVAYDAEVSLQNRIGKW